jgi:hypothetical protein
MHLYLYSLEKNFVCLTNFLKKKIHIKYYIRIKVPGE